MHSNNISRIEKVAKGLGSINEEVVYVGGSVAEFYVIDSAKSDVRQTMDVDCVTHLKSYHELTSLEERLRSCGFQNGIRIWIFSLPYYIATKIEAVNGRGGTDWRWSHDFEDLVYIFNYNKNIAEELQKADDDLKEFFKEEFAKMLKRTNIREEIECKLPYGEENRVDYIIEMIKKLS